MDDAQLAAAHDMYAADGHLHGVRSYVESTVGYPNPTDSQLLLAIGTHGWRVGSNLGDQSYQRRMARQGRPMPRLGARGSLSPTGSPAPARVSTARRFGIEVEFNSGTRGTYYRSNDAQQADVVADMVAKGIPSYVESHYTHAVPTSWKMTNDCTVTGGEFVSPILRVDDAGLNEVREAIRSIKAAGGAAGQGQGLHVHHDVTDFSQDDMGRLVRNLRNAERAILAYVPQYRYNGTGRCRANLISDQAWARYERAVQSGELAPMANRAGRDHWNRYVSFNFCAVLVQGTVEFRALGNSLNPIKVRAWIELGSALVCWTKDGGTFTDRQSPESLVTTLVASGHLSGEAARVYRAEVTRRHGSDALNVAA